MKTSRITTACIRTSCADRTLLFCLQELEAKTTQIIGWENAEKAREIVSECQERYSAKPSER